MHHNPTMIIFFTRSLVSPLMSEILSQSRSKGSYSH
uniref:Uncharacterized protein n=1 Tax=Arundo donax TaxID=35708 RepID=A0A0A9C3F1_ARUDO